LSNYTVVTLLDASFFSTLAYAPVDMNAITYGFSQGTVGIFINPYEPLQVAKIADLTKMQGYDPAMDLMDAMNLVAAQEISIEEVMAAFPGLPVFTYPGSELVKIVDAADIYDSGPTGTTCLGEDANSASQ
jgi:hypothetical protein